MQLPPHDNIPFSLPFLFLCRNSLDPSCLFRRILYDNFAAYLRLSILNLANLDSRRKKNIKKTALILSAFLERDLFEEITLEGLNRI